MKKRVVSFVLILILTVSILPIYAAAAGSLTNFMKTKTYPAGLFSDVTAEWFASEVKACYEYTLVEGTTPTTFSPVNKLTLSEAIKLAACLNDIYNNGTPTLKKGDPIWYQPYVDYALSHNIIEAPFPDYTAYATRAVMADIFANALPDDALTPINTIIDNAIPDVSITHTSGASIYKLYRAGVLSGTDAAHTYKPDDTISRAETASIVTRMAGIDRVSFTMSGSGTTSGTPSGTTEFTVTASQSEVSIPKGAQVTVYFTVSSLDFSLIVPAIGDSAVASCTWGIRSNNTIPLTIFGLSGGSTTITVRLFDADSNVLAEAAVAVTVSGESGTATGFFPGYYPVPDYGMFVDLTPHTVKYDTLNGSTLYAYKKSDLTVDYDFAFNGYEAVLEQNGFSFYSTLTSPDGDIIVVYTNSEYHLKVYFTDAKIDGVPSIIVKATPF